MAPSAKRTRTREIGAPSAQDDVWAAPQISASASSTRIIPSSHIPWLSTLCCRVFAANFLRLHQRQNTWDRTKAQLEIIPDNLVPKLLALLSSNCPTYLPSEVLVTYFLRGPSLIWTSDLTGVKKQTIEAIPRINKSLQELTLKGFEKFKDETFAAVVSRLPDLRLLNLAGCRNVGAKTVEAAATCSRLRVANFNHTSVPPVSIANLLVDCTELEVLKVAKISSWTDATFAKFLSTVDADWRHVNLRTFKLRQTSLSDASMAALCEMFPNLQRLDVSFTAVKRPAVWLGPIAANITKLSLTSTATSPNSLVNAIGDMSNLKTLAIGALGVGSNANTSVSNTSAMTLSDDLLYSLTDVLAAHGKLESLNLVGNAKLGQLSKKGDGALQHMIRVLGRNCKYLNLSAIGALCSSDFAGLVPDVENNHTAPALQTLLVNNTGVDDGAAQFLASCVDLETLGMAGTKVTDEGLFPIVDACTKLANLDLTSCRGVGVVDRRRFFEVWEESRQA
ncbi:RNI-like protein [Cylindrobasidium torrendii FP15055 ss-10]|uniref:RNI-like protein n=1 Tax=Cylindrobasidium torrendii FP15055 ss-10 TaxID=1314674 RepID=A0A0D7B5Q6_9AGAR|nr:RNI-like protein [Cylindrobasidium torrendii FP15055 ss-10]